MKKQTSVGFGKEVYLLGVDEEGTKYWLEAPSWDCDWYWGFGYVETYQGNRNPSIARDIDSHQHFNGLFLKGNGMAHDRFKNFFKESTVDSSELWKLLELMSTFYTLKETAEVFGRGGVHYANNPCKELIQDKGIADKINKEILPQLFEEVKKILTPTE